MASRTPLVLVNGQIQQLQAGDTLSGITATALATSQNSLAADTTVLAGTSAYVPQYLEVTSGFTLEVADTAYLEIG